MEEFWYFHLIRLILKEASFYIYIFNVARVLFILWLSRTTGGKVPHCHMELSQFITMDSQFFLSKGEGRATLMLRWFERTCKWKCKLCWVLHGIYRNGFPQGALQTPFFGKLTAHFHYVQHCDMLAVHLDQQVLIPESCSHTCELERWFVLKKFF